MVTVRKGKYALYQGKEYKIYSNKKNGGYDLVSEDESDLEKGFTEEYPSTYTKNVGVEDITSFFKIVSYAIYRGEKFDISAHVQDGKVNLGTTSAAIAQKFDFQKTINTSTKNGFL